MSAVPEWMATFKKEMLAEMKVMIDASFDMHSERNKVFRLAHSKSMKASLVQDRLYIDDSLYTAENICSVPFSISQLH